MPAVAFRPRYTVQDYLGWKGDWELWDGYPVSMSPSPKFNHGEAVAELSFSLKQQFKASDKCGDCRAVAEIDWQVDEHTVVRPDLSVICGVAPDDWIESAPVLVAEFLSPSTREKDLTSKKELYAQQGVRFYVIGDPEAKELTVLELGDSGYSEVDGEGMEIHGGCEVRVKRGDVFS